MNAIAVTAGGTLKTIIRTHSGSPTTNGMKGVQINEKQHAADTRYLRNLFGYGHAPVCRVHECNNEWYERTQFDDQLG